MGYECGLLVYMGFGLWVLGFGFWVLGSGSNSVSGSGCLS